MVLLDALMPGMDGFEVARRLKANAATAPIPIIFMTGLTETEHVVAAFAAGGAKSVTKPIRAQEMLARVVEAMVQALKLTLREAELLCWLGKGKTHRDIGDIPGSVPGDRQEAPHALLREAQHRNANGHSRPRDETAAALTVYVRHQCRLSARQALGEAPIERRKAAAKWRAPRNPAARATAPTGSVRRLSTPGA